MNLLYVWEGEVDPKQVLILCGWVICLESCFSLSINKFKMQCIELMSIEWKNYILTKPKLGTYKEIKKNFVVEPYVTNNVTKHHRPIYAQFRCGILPLHIETGRYANIRDPQTGNYRTGTLNETERVCYICKSNNVEDEQHFL